MSLRIAVVALMVGMLLSFAGGCRRGDEKERQPAEGSTSHVGEGGHTGAGPQVGEKAPVFSLNDVEGNTHDLTALIGKKTLAVVFWGAWCDICKEEIPSLKRMQATYADRGFQIVSIAVKETPDQPDADFLKEVADFTKEKELNFTVLLDPKYQAVGLYHLHGVPTIIVVDLKGDVRHTGHSADEAEAIVKKLLAG